MGLCQGIIRKHSVTVLAVLEEKFFSVETLTAVGFLHLNMFEASP